MRVTVGACAILGLAVATVGAQPPRERAAVLKPPQALGDVPPVARGVSDELPNTSYLPSTPVARLAAPPNPAARWNAPAGPSWLRGVDPHVTPAAGTGPKGANVQQLSPPPPAKPEPSFVQRGVEKIRSLGGNGDRAAPPTGAPVTVNPQSYPTQQQPQPVPTAATPFRGTSPSGAPVYAGPPAYRWYGWGSVTPGANPAAPSGEYPKASAAWYAITGATPGAFPVPVTDPTRPAPGFDPPSYVGAPGHLPPNYPVVNVGSPSGRPGYAGPQPAPQFQPVERPQPAPAPAPAPHPVPAPESKFMPAPGIGASPPPPVSIPKITPPPAPPAPVTIRETPPPVPAPDATVTLPPLPAIPVPAAPTLPVVPSVEPSVAPPAEKPVRATPPAPLPSTLTEEPRWGPTTKPAAPGTWAPAGSNPPQPKPQEGQGWQGSQGTTGTVVVRAQQPDTNPDPIGALVRQMCQGRAVGVEIRWAGPKKLVVCFETRTADAAQKLVADISKRPELGPYQIDFCVVVK